MRSVIICMMKKKLLFLGVALIVLIASFILLPRHRNFDPSAKIWVGETPINAAVADTPEERSRGLSGVSSLKSGQGMLFIFDEPLLAGFWMKDMNFAIDIIWIDAGGLVIGIEKRVEPSTFPQIFGPPEAVLYVLEVPAGFSDTAGIELGEKLSIGQ